MNHMESAVQPMEYPVLQAGGVAALDRSSPVGLAERVRELEAEREAMVRNRSREMEVARREGLEQGRTAANGEDAAWRNQCAAQLAGAIEEFRGHRDRYLAQVEHEVVRLALAVAERILHREAQMDPLLLSGAVRVALGRLADSTEVRLRVPAAQREMWAEMLRLMPALPLRPEVVTDAQMQTTEAQLETALGRVDLGVRAQIEEIERGFFDLLEVRAKEGRPGTGKQG